MELWQPSPDEPELFDWWRPLLVVGRRAREARIYWPIHIDEFEFKGRVDRGSRPAVWVYEHRKTGREMLVDWHGQTYEFIRYRRGRQLGRFNEIGIRSAVWRARLPDVVEPVSYDDEPTEAEPAVLPCAPPASVRRGHLTLVPPPPNLN